MFDYIAAESWYRAWSRRAFFVLAIGIMLFLFRGRPSVIYISRDPLWISNKPNSVLPSLLSEILSYGYYEGTAAALALAFVCSLICNRNRRTRPWTNPGTVWYLPAFVAGIEGMRHAQLLGSRHDYFASPTLADLKTEWITAAIASLLVVAICIVLGFVFAKLARDSTRLPVATLGLVLSVSAGWFGAVSLLWLLA